MGLFCIVSTFFQVSVLGQSSRKFEKGQSPQTLEYIRKSDLAELYFVSLEQE